MKARGTGGARSRRTWWQCLLKSQDCLNLESDVIWHFKTITLAPVLITDLRKAEAEIN